MVDNGDQEPVIRKKIKIGKSEYTILFPDLLPPLTGEQRKSLREAIRKSGRIFVPVVKDEENGIIDGINRLELAAELGLRDIEIPFITEHGLTEDQKRARALELNLERRHISPEQKRATIAWHVKMDPTQSNRALAEKLNVSDHTVAGVKRQLVQAKEIPKADKVVGKDKKERKASSEAIRLAGGQATQRLHKFEKIDSLIGEIARMVDGLAGPEKKGPYRKIMAGLQGVKKALASWKRD